MISIIVPLYNQEKFLRKALQSCKNQKSKDLEFIIIDDGSTDTSAEICKDFLEQDDRFSYYYQPNGGYGIAMNHGLSKSKGNYIAILEPDDYFADNIFEQVENALKSQSELPDIVKFNFQKNFLCAKTAKVRTMPNILVGYENKKVTNYQKSPEIIYNMPSIWTGVYKRSFLDKVSFAFMETPGASYQDTSFFIYTITQAESILYIEEYGLFYTVHENSSSGKASSKKHITTIFTIFNHIQKEYHINPNYNIYLSRVYFNMIFWHFDRIHFSKKREFLKAFHLFLEQFPYIVLPTEYNGKIELLIIKQTKKRQYFSALFCLWSLKFARRLLSELNRLFKKRKKYAA